MRHPVLGPVACLVAVKQIAKGEEVFIFYHKLFLIVWYCQETGDVFFLIQSVFGCLALPKGRVNMLTLMCFLFTGAGELRLQFGHSTILVQKGVQKSLQGTQEEAKVLGIKK